MKKESRIYRSSEQEMFPHVAAWFESDESKKDFCDKRNIKRHVFDYWFKKYRRLSNVPEGFVNLRVPTTFSDNIQIHYPNGVRLELPQGVEISCVEQMIKINV